MAESDAEKWAKKWRLNLKAAIFDYPIKVQMQ